MLEVFHPRRENKRWSGYLLRGIGGRAHLYLFLSETACDGAVWKLYQVPEFALVITA